MPGYLLKQECIAIGGVDDLIIRSLLDRQQFADPEGEAERLGISSAAWPLFGLLWPSGLKLALRLAARPVSASEKILEIGCGLALASLVGHRRGADVTASDCHPLADRFLQENLRLNGLLPMKYLHGQWNTPAELLAVATLAGLLPAPLVVPMVVPAVPAVLPLRVVPVLPVVRPSVQGRYNLIIGSDLLYERDSRGGLASFIGRHAAADAEVWIVDPDRSNRAAFNRQMHNTGFVSREERLDHPASAGVAAYKGRLLVYNRGAVPPAVLAVV